MPASASERSILQQTEWLTPFGVTVNEVVRPRVNAPCFVYRGNADEHLRGQSCYPDPDSLATGHGVSVIMACGCRMTVPWWTLEAVEP